MKILCITPIKHIAGLETNLRKIGALDILEDPSEDDVKKIIHNYDAIFTNPNKSKVYIGKNILENAKKLKIVCTASTGTVHIDKEYLNLKKIKLLSLTKELAIINKISSTAEHAFALMMASIRKIVQAQQSTKNYIWNYEPYIGRQLNNLNILIFGFGRLGKKFARYCDAFDSNIFVYDPYVEIDKKFNQVNNLDEVKSLIDVLSIHVHVTEETKYFFNKDFFKGCKDSLSIINTSRGELINEDDLINFLKQNPKSSIASDVVDKEIFGFENSSLFKFSLDSEQVLLTPHIGGMTSDAQEIAYNHAAYLLNEHVNNSND